MPFHIADECPHPPVCPGRCRFRYPAATTSSRRHVAFGAQPNGAAAQSKPRKTGSSTRPPPSRPGCWTRLPPGVIKSVRRRIDIEVLQRRASIARCVALCAACPRQWCRPRPRCAPMPLEQVNQVGRTRSGANITGSHGCGLMAPRSNTCRQLPPATTGRSARCSAMLQLMFFWLKASLAAPKPPPRGAVLEPFKTAKLV